MSVRAIARELGVAQSSVSVWVRDVAVPVVAPPERPVTPEIPLVLDSRTKICGSCRRELSLSLFNRAGSGRQHWCRDCFRVYFRNRGKLHVEQSNRAKRQRIEVCVGYLRDFLSTRPCQDCGEGELAVLEFDHVGAKTHEIAELVFAGDMQRLGRELRECEVVCACCHRRRTATRAGWARATGVYPSHWPAYYVRNLKYVVEVLRRAGCVDCGEGDPVVLDFDHVGEKRSGVSRLVPSASLTRLKEEIAQCEVRCANCHRLVTYARRGGTWRDAPDWAA